MDARGDDVILALLGAVAYDLPCYGHGDGRMDAMQNVLRPHSMYF